MKRYNPNEIEPKWQKTWDENKSYVVNDADPRPKYYHLVEFPYPSGVGLHVGHSRSYVAFDVMSRWRRMTGENVLYPIGWDAFGLPAEQYAVKTGVHPSETTRTNIDTFRKQAKALGLSFDWSREFSTADPKIYKWTQWIFLNLFKSGLAYQADSMIWWCEELKSVLADEEVIDGKSERGGYPCVRRPLRQWMLAITKYADRLYDDLDDVDYIEPVKISQRNWIGKSKGSEIIFKTEDGQDIVVFTTRADTLFGATYLVLAPEHPLVKQLTTPNQAVDVEKYIKSTASKSDLTRQEDDKNKTGVFIGSYAINPVNNQKIPIWISDYVLMSYGTGAIMAVPAHDSRDNEFARKFNLPIVNVIDPVIMRDDVRETKEFTDKKKIVAIVVSDKKEILTINWGDKYGGRLFIGGTVENNETPEQTAIREIREETGYDDLEILEVGYETCFYKYYAFSKNQAVSAQVKFLYIKIKSDRKIERSLDESEKNKFNVEWVDKDTAQREVVEPLHKYAFDKFILKQSYGGEGVIANSGKYNGISSSIAREKIVDDLTANKLAQEKINYRLRDWVFSRQRYWGEPFPIVWTDMANLKNISGVVADWLPNNPVTKNVDGKELVALPIPSNYLPVELPMVKDFQPKGLGRGPLAQAVDWTNIWFNTETGETKSRNQPKPENGTWIEATRETDTMPNWAGSSWYYIRYADPLNDQAVAARDKIDKWLPVSWYNGGMEHTTLHLLYSRFWHKYLFDIGVVNTSEPYKKRTSHGIIIASDGKKMSKSIGNVIDPMQVVGDYGADTLRLYICFIGPFEQSVVWNVNGVAGSRRFIERFWTLIQEFIDGGFKVPSDTKITNKELNLAINKLNKKVSVDIPRLGFNTAVAALMEAINVLYKIRKAVDFKDAPEDWGMVIKQLVLIASPFMPHLCEEIWSQLGFDSSVLNEKWPLWDESALTSDKVTIVIQVNGKLRGSVVVTKDTPEDDVVSQAKELTKVKEHIGSSKLNRVIYLPNKLINFVIDI